MKQGRETVIELAFASLMGSATEEQQAALSQLIEEDSEARSQYLDFLLMFTQLHRRNGASLFISNDAKPMLDRELVNVLLKEERSAPAVEPVLPMEDADAQTQSTQNLTPKRHVSRLWPVLAITSLAAMLVIVIGAQIAAHVRPIPVATLEDSYRAQWADTVDRKTGETRLSTNSEPLTLQRGMVKLAFDNQASLVIEGPAQFQILKAHHIQLKYGLLYATVPAEASGFIVSTPSATVKDIGTEFGVHTDQVGHTELHVTSGITELYAGATLSDAGMTVTEGVAKKIELQTQAITTIQCEEKTFVHDFNSSTNFVWYGQGLDLDEIVWGGNGLGQSQYPAIKVLSSRTSHHGYDIDLTVADGYQTIEHPFIDGIFVPDGKQSPVLISSENHIFKNCPATSGLSWFKHVEYIMESPEFEWVPKHTLKFAGQDYRHPENRALILHASGGITFDLLAMRNALPGRTITHFTSRIGLAENLYTDARLKGRDLNNYQAGFHILVDGQLHYSRNDVTAYDGIIDIDIPLHNHERFLTLVTTGDNKTDNNFLWCLFAEPLLHLK